MQILRYKLKMGPERTVRMIWITMIKYSNLMATHLSMFQKITIKEMITVANQSLRTTHFSPLKAILLKMDRSTKNIRISPKFKIMSYILKMKMQLKKKMR
jgi:hypothetical protein